MQVYLQKKMYVSNREVFVFEGMDLEMDWLGITMKYPSEVMKISYVLARIWIYTSVCIS